MRSCKAEDQGTYNLNESILRAVFNMLKVVRIILQRSLYFNLLVTSFKMKL